MKRIKKLKIKPLTQGKKEKTLFPPKKIAQKPDTD